jgi:ribonuclease Z
MAEKIKLTFLGTSGAIPSAKRNHTAILLTYKGENILVDCGEGTQRQFRKARMNPCKLTRLLITHWHTDHILGIPGLLKTLGLSGYNKKLFVYGPRRTKFFMKMLLKLFRLERDVSTEIKDISGKFFETNDFYLEAESMTHGIPCHAYSFVKKGQIRIDKKKLRKSRLPVGFHLKKLKQGKNVWYKGRKYLAKNLTFREPGKKVSFVLDTSPNKKIPSFVKNSDILVCEASFGSELKAKSKDYKHLTAKQAAEIAKKSNSKKLILTHVSQRYEKDPKKILVEAKKTFRNSSFARDLDVILI